MGRAASRDEAWRRRVGHADEIPKGAKRADLPVEQPAEGDFGIHLKTAKVPGHTIPQSLLLCADEAIR